MQVVSAAVVVGVESVFLGPAVLEFWAGVGVEDEVWVGGAAAARRGEEEVMAVCHNLRIMAEFERIGKTRLTE